MTSDVRNNLVIKKFVVGSLGTNCYVLYDRQTKQGILIDPGFYDPDITQFLQENEVTLKAIVDTHGHLDHILGNSAFGVQVLIHEADGFCLEDPARNLSRMMSQEIPKVSDIKFINDGDTVSFGGITMDVIHTPGHTPGSISLKYDDVLFSGDTLFFEGIGRTDLPGGDHNAIIESIKNKLFILPDNFRVFPGHGPETTIGHEKKNNPWIT